MKDFHTSKDALDQWLQENIGVIPGCSSSIESLKYDIARETAEKIMQHMINETCEWMNSNTSWCSFVDHESQYRFDAEHYFFKNED